MQFICLLFGISTLIIISCFFSDGDVLMPSVVLNMSYILSLLVLLLSPFEFELHWNTVGTILLGLFSFQFVELLLFSRIKNINISKIKKRQVSYLSLLIVLVVQILTIFLYVQEIKRIGQSGLWESVKNMRRTHMYASSMGNGEYIKFYVSRLMKVNYAAGYVNAYFLVRDITCRRRTKYTFFFFVSVCIYIVQAILSGGRAQSLRLFFGMFITVLLAYKMEYGWKSKLRFSTIVKVMLGVVIAGAAFYGSRMFFGRMNQANLSFISIFASYYSGGIYLFDAYIQHPFRNKGDLVGSQTFKDFFNLLYKYGLRHTRIIPQLEFRDMGNTVNNTYTAFRYYYQDYGIMGIVLLQIIFSIVFNVIYSKVKKEGKEHFVVAYSFIFFALIMHCISDQFFSILSFGYIETIVWILLLWLFETKIAIRIKHRTGDVVL